MKITRSIGINKTLSFLYFGRCFGRRSIRNSLAACLIILVLHVFGVFKHPFEISVSEFSYPLSLPNLREIVDSLINGINSSHVASINSYEYQFLIANAGKCISSSENDVFLQNSKEEDKRFGEVFLIYVIKSALKNFKSRSIIRKTWGSEQRFSDVVIKRVFVVGSCEKSFTLDQISHCEEMVQQEALLFKDIVQADFTDNYYNNTIKTMIGIRWVVHHCPLTHYIAFIDDDFYVSPKNLLKFLREPFSEFLLEGLRNLPARFKQYDGRLFSGYVMPNSSPMRHQTSKWYISLNEYPYDKYPPYITAGAYVLSNRALKEMYYASFYTKHFRFDDIFLAILAKRLEISLLHNSNFYFWKKPYGRYEYSKVIASHGYDDHDELLKVYDEQKSIGHA